MNTTRQQDSSRERAVQIPIGQVTLQGDLAVPDSARGVVLFAHGSGSGRLSPRNRYVAQVLQESGLATLLMDLLTSEEEAFDFQTAALRFDISLLASRLIEATRWLLVQSETAQLPVGYFGASTGAAAALVAAADLPDLIESVVSRGGRPDLAGERLRKVVAPTLLIVGSRDYVVLELNRKALAELRGEKKLEIVPGATHLFEEPGTLEAVAQLARDWFVLHLGRANDRRRAA
ncbi:MAG: dienelactone hydrolase-like enzyme [Acidobacteriaceae bacterium]|jgi:putative phosphoribosyl transferase|nr:dienelactone hydrolase-like enzyme [Acidobacteriaceae bacterium]